MKNKTKKKKLLQNHVQVYVCVYAHQTTFQSFHHHNYIEIMIFCFSQNIHSGSLSGCHSYYRYMRYPNLLASKRTSSHIFIVKSDGFFHKVQITHKVKCFEQNIYRSENNPNTRNRVPPPFQFF